MALPFFGQAMRRTLQAAAELVQRAWHNALRRAPLTTAERAVYGQGLQAAGRVDISPDGTQARVTVTQMDPAVTSLEEGHPAYHLPSRINWAQSRAARRNKSGRYYLIIPFTHRAPGGAGASRPGFQRSLMSYGVYGVARALQPGQRLTAGPSRGRAVHAPGLRPYVPRYARNVRPGYTHAAREEGMQRRPQGGRRGTYLTFRVMTQDSPGWWIPARHGVQVADKVQREATPRVEALVRDAVAQDIRAALQERLGR